jgi:two-component sensor histidine kinase
MVGSHTDITERKQTEEALSNLLDQLENIVEERTAELTKINESLQTEISERQAALRERKRSEEQLQASLLEKEVLLKEVYHRVKNNLQVISSLLSLQSEYIKDKQDIEIFQQSQQRIASMALIHEKMYQSPDLARINLREYVEDLVISLCTSYDRSASAIALSINIEEHILLGLDTAIPCGLIIHELVSNSLKYAFPVGRKGEISIEVKEIVAGKILLNVKDDGVGLPTNFNFADVASLGWQLVDALASQLTGNININSDIGVEFQITFPIG